MKTYNFLICYDISDDKRLRKVAKILEQDAIRIQKSVFFYQTIANDSIKDIIKNLNEIISDDEDDVRIYKIDIQSALSINSAIDLKIPNLIGGITDAKYI